MKKLTLIVFLGTLLGLLLSACGQENADKSAQAIEGYIQALVAQDANRVISLSCADWEDDAQVELDSLTAVSAEIEGLSCQQTGLSGSEAQVTCLGKIVFDYDGEIQELELAGRIFVALDEAGEWRMCGYR